MGLAVGDVGGFVGSPVDVDADVEGAGDSGEGAMVDELLDDCCGGVWTEQAASVTNISISARVAVVMVRLQAMLHQMRGIPAGPVETKMQPRVGRWLRHRNGTYAVA